MPQSPSDPAVHAARVTGRAAVWSAAIGFAGIVLAAVIGSVVAVHSSKQAVAKALSVEPSSGNTDRDLADIRDANQRLVRDVASLRQSQLEDEGNRDRLTKELDFYRQSIQRLEDDLKVAKADRAGTPHAPDAGTAARLSRLEKTTEVLSSQLEAVAKNSSEKASAARPVPDELRAVASLPTVDIAPLFAALTSVDFQISQVGDVRVPRVRCRFTLENRSPTISAAIAINQRVRTGFLYRIDSRGYRGGLVDAAGAGWTLAEVEGIPGVAGFEFSERQIGQMNPGGIVDYLRNAKRVDGKIDENLTGRFWTGSLGSIGPLGKLSITLDFVRTDVWELLDNDKTGDRYYSRETRETINVIDTPRWCNIDAELVTGTFSGANAALGSKDLTVRQLSLERVPVTAK